MKAGLEFIRSWRFWILFVAWTSAVTLGSAGVHVALSLYLPAEGVEPDAFYSLLGGFTVFVLSTSLFWFICLRKRQDPPYPNEYQEMLSLFIAVLSAVIEVLEWAVVDWLVVEPIVPNAPGNPIHALFIFLFAMSFGQWIAKKEWAVMTGAGGAADRPVTPNSP